MISKKVQISTKYVVVSLAPSECSVPSLRISGFHASRPKGDIKETLNRTQGGVTCNNVPVADIPLSPPSAKPTAVETRFGSLLLAVQYWIRPAPL